MKDKIFLFVLCPPYSGSTIMYKILDSSDYTSTLINNNNGQNGEGQWLLSKYGLTDYITNRWNPDYILDMEVVKQCYYDNWDLTKNILVEKSPPNICRAKLLENHFSKFGKVYFIILMKNPYSCRYNANDWVQYAKYQKDNLESLKNTLYIKFEDILLNPEESNEKILNFLPNLHYLNFHITDTKGIAKNKQKDIDKSYIYKVINKNDKNFILARTENLQLMKYFGYCIL
jgi:RNA recognition motif-containing protein